MEAKGILDSQEACKAGLLIARLSVQVASLRTCGTTGSQKHVLPQLKVMTEIVESWDDLYDVDIDASKGGKPKKPKKTPNPAAPDKGAAVKSFLREPFS